MKDNIKRLQPIAQFVGNRPEPMSLRRDIARLLDNLYGLHVRPGHIDAVMEVFAKNSQIKEVPPHE